MNLISFLYRLTDRRPSKLIRVNGQDYLERIHLASLFGWEFAIHRFLIGDGDEHLHDHPWSGFSFILAGAYAELHGTAHTQGALIPGSTHMRYRVAGEIVPLGLSIAHRIITVRRDTWTLVAHGPRVRAWGFYEDGAWTPATNQTSGAWWKECTSRASRRREALQELGGLAR
ncbi:MAG: hypothetical protein HYV16_12155 [Gammaproteobacteria bacterium]|nr:hypothetical protein [Gammaproteobacteria bacterium]